MYLGWYFLLKEQHYCKYHGLEFSGREGRHNILLIKFWSLLYKANVAEFKKKKTKKDTTLYHLRHGVSRAAPELEFRQPWMNHRQTDQHPEISPSQFVP